MTATPSISTLRAFPSLAIAALLALPWALTGCPGDQLPEGWEDAETMDELQVEDLGATDFEDPELGTAVISGNLDRLEVLYLDTFPCSDELEAHKLVDGTDIDILVQPTDLHPDAVTGSNCTFELDMVVLDLDDGTYHVSIFRRDSDQVDPDLETVLVTEGDAILGFAE